MGLPNLIVMPGDNAANPITIVGTRRTYRCNTGSSIAVPGEDANILCSSGWVSSSFQRAGANGVAAAGTTAQRPTRGILPGQVYQDTTVGALIVWGGPKTGWLHHQTGASV
jgi:hypothetical protein